MRELFVLFWGRGNNKLHEYILLSADRWLLYNHGSLIDQSNKSITIAIPIILIEKQEQRELFTSNIFYKEKNIALLYYFVQINKFCDGIYFIKVRLRLEIIESDNCENEFRRLITQIFKWTDMNNILQILCVFAENKWAHSKLSEIKDSRSITQRSCAYITNVHMCSRIFWTDITIYYYWDSLCTDT